MSESSRKPPLLPGLYYLAGMIYAPLLYVLSIGPVAGLVSCGVIPANMMQRLERTVYAPLMWLLEASPTICEVLARYESLFVP